MYLAHFGEQVMTRELIHIVWLGYFWKIIPSHPRTNFYHFWDVTDKSVSFSKMEFCDCNEFYLMLLLVQVPLTCRFAPHNLHITWHSSMFNYWCYTHLTSKCNHICINNLCIITHTSPSGPCSRYSERYRCWHLVVAGRSIGSLSSLSVRAIRICSQP